MHSMQKWKKPKVTVTAFSSGCLQIGFGVPIINYICNFLIWIAAKVLKKGAKVLNKGAKLLKKGA